MLKPKVLFLCGSNACRTQMAEGFLRDMAGDHFEIASGGYEPATEICREAVTAMAECGIDISEQYPKSIDAFVGQRVSYAITVCDRTKERSCPIFPGVVWRATWPLEDPRKTEPGERPLAVRRARDEIRRLVTAFVNEHSEMPNKDGQP
ncbi:MAG TPA: arsenate reductase ArsC [Bryobacteraceae bacterium]